MEVSAMSIGEFLMQESDMRLTSLRRGPNSAGRFLRRVLHWGAWINYLVSVIESGAIVGTEFGRVVPNFVAQQRPIREAITLRDEVSRRGLTRGNLSWASAGLDTGRPGYTLGMTPQPHNEGDFTALGRVVRGIDAVDRLELGDAITAARRVR
jgi:cyclophilin family peptidyl-prolyl cis-trans isomerase